MRIKMRCTELVVLAHRELRGRLRLLPWLCVALLIGLVLSHTNLASVGLFQSIVPTDPFQSVLPTPVETVTSLPEVPSPTSTVALPETTTVPTLPAELPTAEAPTPEPAQTATSQPLASPTEALPEQPAVPEMATPATAAATAEEQRYPQEKADLRFDWPVLLDSLALGISYLWLVCGIVLLLVAIVVLAYLWLSSKGHLQKN
jgi:hypothetical protein